MSDRYHLERFVKAQESSYDRAYDDSELKKDEFGIRQHLDME